MGSSKDSRYDSFIAINDVKRYIHKKYRVAIDQDRLSYLIVSHILPIYTINEETFCIKEDLNKLVKALEINSNITSILTSDNLFQLDQFKINDNLIIDYMHEDNNFNPAIYSSLRNLSEIALAIDSQREPAIDNISLIPPIRILTSSQIIKNEVYKKQSRFNMVDESKSSYFSRSAHYMGSKRILGPYLVEAISSVLPDDGIVVDLMCGSGAASGAFNKIWKTISSDAQMFCVLLSVIQGGGFSRKKAIRTIELITRYAQNNIKALKIDLAPYLQLEENYFHSEVNNKLLVQYNKFIVDYPTYPFDNSSTSLKFNSDIADRQADKNKFPFCLFSYYFANIYFGLRQCIEIDSIRYAIDRLDDEQDRQWALGALIVAASSLATTYGGHFAQPLSQDFKNMSIKKATKILEKRTYSIFHEFSIRLLNLAQESEKSTRIIETIEGPWEVALDSLKKKYSEKILVYLDAPYKREEYSRYYHVLETLVSYSYPSCTGKGKLPIKDKERFSSDFFTKNRDKLNNVFIQLITNIINNGWICGWSYSNSGDTDMIYVIESVKKNCMCTVKSYSAPFIHKAHGGRKPKSVNEYLVLFIPNTKENQ